MSRGRLVTEGGGEESDQTVPPLRGTGLGSEAPLLTCQPLTDQPYQAHPPLREDRAGRATRVAGAVLVLVGLANAVAAITPPPKAPVSGAARAMLVLTSAAVAAMGLALATRRRW